jgi:hypothetical protein
MLAKITQPVGEAWGRWARAILPWLIGLAFVVVEICRVAVQVAARYPVAMLDSSSATTDDSIALETVAFDQE